MVRRKKSNAEELSANISEHYVRMDIDIQALRTKNKDLVQSVAKLQKEKTFIQKQLNGIQEDYFKLNSKYVNLKSVFSTIDNTTKLTVSKITDGVNHLAKIMHLCAVGSAVCGLNKEPRTMTVQPHMVNGTIINNPTITLSRFIDSDSPEISSNSEPQPTTPQRRRISQNFAPGSATVPSTSGDLNESFSYFFNNSNNKNGEEEAEIVNDNVSQRRRRTTLTESPEVEDVQEEDDEFGGEDEEANEQDYSQQLRTITEESEEHSTNSSATLTDRVPEIRIYLQPIPVNHTKNVDNSSVSFVERTSSLTAEASNSISDNTLFNESQGSPHKIMQILNTSIDISLPSPSQSRFDGFEKTIIETPDLNRPSCSFMNSMSSIMSNHTLQEDGCTDNNSSDMENSKITTLRSLGLMEKNSEQMATSTPVQNQRTSRRLVEKSNGISQSKSKTIQSNVTKRKESSGTKVAKVIIQRLNLDKNGNARQSLSNILDTRPITSATDVRIRRSKELKMSDTSSNSESEETENKKTVQTKGKENRKMPPRSTQTIMSPRPKRAARPKLLRETSLKKKMRRSR